MFPSQKLKNLHLPACLDHQTPTISRSNPISPPLPSSLSSTPPSRPSHPTRLTSNSDNFSSSLSPTTLSPQMTDRTQHGIFKPKSLFNLFSFFSSNISPLPTNPCDAFRDLN